MARFRTHIGLGVVIGVAFVVAGLIYSFLASPEAAIWIFLAVLIGSFLPDLDLDDGIPFRIIFGLFGAGLAGLAFLIFYQGGERDIKLLVFIPLFVFTFVRFIGGYVFQNMTRHRGMFHSVPAAVLAGLIAILLAEHCRAFRDEKILIGLAVSAGYLGHLILDEIFSSVNLSGYSIFPKKSFGSALKFYSSSALANFLFYFLVFFLAAGMFL